METLVGVTQTRFPLSVPSSPVARMPEASVAQIERLQRDSPFPSLAAPGNIDTRQFIPFIQSRPAEGKYLPRGADCVPRELEKHLRLAEVEPRRRYTGREREASSDATRCDARRGNAAAFCSPGRHCVREREATERSRRAAGMMNEHGGEN